MYGFTRTHALHYSLSACTYEYQLTRQKSGAEVQSDAQLCFI